MSLTALDPVTALILIDLQQGIVSLPLAHSAEAVVEKAVSLAAAFRNHDLPVVLVNVAGGAQGRTDQSQRPARYPDDWSTLVPALQPQPQDLCITKFCWGAFTHTGLESKLQGLNVTQVVIAGISTSIGVESTARQAYESGFNVTLAVDAMTDTNADAHRNSIELIFPRLGETGTCADIMTLLHQRSAQA